MTSLPEQPSEQPNMVRRMADRWWIQVCPECNGYIVAGTETHNETCPNRFRAYIPKDVEVMPVAEHEAEMEEARLADADLMCVFDALGLEAGGDPPRNLDGAEETIRRLRASVEVKRQAFEVAEGGRKVWMERAEQTEAERDRLRATLVAIADDDVSEADPLTWAIKVYDDVRQALGWTEARS